METVVKHQRDRRETPQRGFPESTENTIEQISALCKAGLTQVGSLFLVAFLCQPLAFPPPTVSL